MIKLKIAKTAIIIVGTIFAVLLVMAPNLIKIPYINKDTASKSTNVKEINLERFKGQIFISGILLDSDANKDDVMTLNNEVYISSDLLNNHFKTKLTIDSGNYTFTVKFIEKKLDDIVKYNDKSYLTLSMLDTYFDYNKHFLINNNQLHIYNISPNNVNFNSERYENYNKTRKLSELNASFAGVSPEGYGIYKTDDKNTIWLVAERDSTDAIQYNKKMDGIDTKGSN